MAKWVKSFGHALNGLINLFRKERNAQIELVIGILVVAASFYFQITRTEWFVVLFCIGGVVGMEALNTALEKALDRLHPEKHRLIGLAKDISAAAVLWVSIIAAIVGAIVFYPYLMELIGR